MEYDALSRLTKLTRYGVVNERSYDSGGNHTRLKAGSQITQYTIDPASNRVASYTGQDGLRKYEYDALGNRISEKVGTQTTTYTYDVFNRMVQSNAGGLTTNYVVNAQGQRMGKYSSASRKWFIYAGQNQLLTEIGQAFAANYLWFGGELVGIARSGKIYPVHTDHLGRPEYATDSTQKTVWKAYNYAYGRSVEQDDIGGLSLGFPGQYQDEETGLWYNGFRDYDASIAWYVQSDPIGLLGGLSTCAYAGGNPVSRFDQDGLQDRLGGVSPPPPPRFPIGDVKKILYAHANDMKAKNWIGADKFYHCMVMCEAASLSEEHAAIASLAGEVRELNQQYRHGDDEAECNADRAANKVGISAGLSGKSCSTSCGGFKPTGMPYP